MPDSNNVLPRRRKIIWTTLHSAFLLALILHFVGFFTYIVFKPENKFNPVTYFDDVDVIKDIPEETKKEKEELFKEEKEMPTPDLEKLKEINKIEPKPDNTAEPNPDPTPDKKPGPVAAPANVPLKMEPPKLILPKGPPVNNAGLVSTDVSSKNAHEDGSPGGREDGKLGGTGTGPGDSTGTGAGDGEGGPGGGGVGNRPYVQWGWNSQTPDENGITKPQLLGANIGDWRNLIGIGEGFVQVKIMIPAATDVPPKGIKPSSVEILEVNPKSNPDARDKMEKIALNAATNSTWHPAIDSSGKPLEMEITFNLYFYGSTEQKY